MKIDLHCHTLNTKTGDGDKRNVDFKLFENKTRAAGVEIIAITNHNFFDYDQYVEFKEVKHAQVWPGIELDVVGDSSKSHCVVVVNPDDVDKFNNICKSNIMNNNPNDFEIGIKEMVDLFSDIDCLYIAHYKKEPEISLKDAEYFSGLLKEDERLFLEPSNLQSAGIMIAHGYNTLIGSDVKDWNKYDKLNIPELKMPIKDFNTFRLLLKKDPEVIKTFIDQKGSEKVNINPFTDLELNLDLYNDVNVFIGGKGTGKTIILKKLEEHYKNQGNNDVISYYGNEKNNKYKDIIDFDIKESDFNMFNLSEEEQSLDFISNWENTPITPTSSYYKWKESEEHNKLRNFGFINATFNDIPDMSKYNQSKTSYNEIKQAYDLLSKQNLELYIPDDLGIYEQIMNNILSGAKKVKIIAFANYHALELEKFTINKMKTLYTSKKASHTKPPGTGLIDLFKSHYDLSNRINVIINLLNSDSKNKEKEVGILSDKGRIYNDLEYSINPDKLDSKSKFLLGASVISTLRSIKAEIIEIKNHIYTDNLLIKITNLKESLTVKDIKGLKDFLGVKGTIRKQDGKEYKPSNGEQSMLILSNVLSDDTKNVYILDEPELSVGNVYVNDVIIPQLKHLARNDKRIIVATHDANIGVRTLPYTVIYRIDKGNDIYETYIGNPFESKLKKIDDDIFINWTEVAMKTLEGGTEAFIERDVIYGKDKY